MYSQGTCRTYRSLQKETHTFRDVSSKGEDPLFQSLQIRFQQTQEIICNLQYQLVSGVNRYKPQVSVSKIWSEKAGSVCPYAAQSHTLNHEM